MLVVEDNVEMSRFIVECLSREFDVHAAFDGQEGYDAAMADPPDLIVSDIMMPRVSGDQMVAKLRTHPRMAEVPILLLSAKADRDLVNHLLGSGAQDFVSKPFNERELLVRSHNLVEVKRAREKAREFERAELKISEERNQQLAERSKQRGALFEQAPSFMVMLRGPNHCIDLANSRFLNLVGERPVLGKTVADVLPDAAEQGFVQQLDQAFISGKANVFTAATYDVRTAPGAQATRRYLDFVQQPIFDSEGNVTGIFVEGTDVTSAHEDRLALIASRADLRQAQKMEAVGQFDRRYRA